MNEKENLSMFDDLLTSNDVENKEEKELQELNVKEDEVLNEYIEDAVNNSDNSDNSNTSDTSNNKNKLDENFIYSFLKEKGIEDPSKLQWEDENGEIKDVNFDDLSNEDKLNVLNSISNTELSKHETEVINYLRQNNVTLNQVIDYFSKKAIEDYLSENPDAKHQKTYTIDDYSDDELYLADLKSKYPNFTDDELTSKLNSAKENEELFKKEIDALRTEYKKEEDEQIKNKEQQDQKDYEDLVNNLSSILNDFNEIALDSTDPESDVLEIEDSDKQQILSYLLDQDSDGKSQLVKDLENPSTLIELAWLRTQGRTLIDNSTRYWKDLLKQERKEKNNLQKELESYKNKGSQSVVVPNNHKNEENVNHRTLESIWNI